MLPFREAWNGSVIHKRSDTLPPNTSYPLTALNPPTRCGTIDERLPRVGFDLALVLREPVVDHVVIALLGHKDMHGETGVG